MEPSLSFERWGIAVDRGRRVGYEVGSAEKWLLLDATKGKEAFRVIPDAHGQVV